ncbi:MAG: helix-turn-helix transcriptional regulator [bacterium]|nr:helix-turn-helix transcriptional regulator [bacterium]
MPYYWGKASGNFFVVAMVRNSEKLINYLTTYRRMQTPYSQRDIAFLVGHSNPTQVIRWENGKRLPSLEHALKLSYITRTPVEVLFSEHLAAAKKEANLREQQLKIFKAQKSKK